MTDVAFTTTDGVRLTGVTWKLAGFLTGPTMPTTMPTVSVYKQAIASAALTQLGSTVTDTSPDRAAFAAWHYLTVSDISAVASEIVDNATYRYFLRFTNASGGNFDRIDGGYVEHGTIQTTSVQNPVVVTSTDPNHVMPAVTPIHGGLAVVNFLMHAHPSDLQNWATNIDASYTLRIDFLVAVGAAMASVLANAGAAPITVEPAAGADPSHPRAVVDYATVSSRTKIVLHIQSRPAHADLKVYNLDIASGYAAKLATAWSEPAMVAFE